MRGGPQGWSMDRVHEGVLGPGPQGWSMDLESMFCIRPCSSKTEGMNFSQKPCNPPYSIAPEANDIQSDQLDCTLAQKHATSSKKFLSKIIVHTVGKNLFRTWLVVDPTPQDKSWGEKDLGRTFYFSVPCHSTAVNCSCKLRKRKSTCIYFLVPDFWDRQACIQPFSVLWLESS